MLDHIIFPEGDLQELLTNKAFNRQRTIPAENFPDQLQ